MWTMSVAFIQMRLDLVLLRRSTYNLTFNYNEKGDGVTIIYI